ncbi:hypothetical protein Leryth_023869 [Lithospermum erythrorhizon]|nr:hypothetical protein Leryth_023869 [Lithospermum erythrorhizon]
MKQKTLYIGNWDRGAVIFGWIPGGTRVRDLWKDGAWDEAKLSGLLSQAHVDLAKAVFIDQGAADKVIWKLSSDGHFNFKCAFEENRQPKELFAVSSVLWHQNITRKMSFLAWRSLHK